MDNEQITTGYSPENSALFDDAERLEIDGHTVTFGFEAEFKCTHDGREHALRVAEIRDGVLHARTSTFPFLMPTGNIEGTGNWEVQSKPYAVLRDCLRDMRIIKEALRPASDVRSELRSFHLHMRFPKSVCRTAEDQRNFDSWISRLGDVILFWRLQHRNVEFALDAWSQHRNEVAYIWHRGPVRLLKNRVRDLYDLELRGFMSSRAKICQLTRTICTALKARSFPGFPNFQEQSTAVERQRSLVDLFHRHGRQLTDVQVALLSSLESSATYDGRGNVVLFGYENAPFFSDVERASVQSATRQFVHNFDFDRCNTAQPYRLALRDWAQSLNLHHALLVTIIPTFGRSLGAEFELSIDENRPTLTDSEMKAFLARIAAEFRARGVSAVARTYRGSHFHVFQIKPDGSLPGASFEMVSPILNWDGRLTDLQRALTVATELGAHVNTKCSLHVHLGLEGVSLAQLKSACLNFLAIEEALDGAFPVTRRNSPYCQSNLQHVQAEARRLGFADAYRLIQSATTVEEVTRFANPEIPGPNNGRPGRRYYKLNLQRVIELRTIEFRQHDPTVDFEAARCWVSFLVTLLGLPAIGTNGSPRERLAVVLRACAPEVRNHFERRLQEFASASAMPSSGAAAPALATAVAPITGGDPLAAFDPNSVASASSVSATAPSAVAIASIRSAPQEAASGDPLAGHGARTLGYHATSALLASEDPLARLGAHALNSAPTAASPLLFNAPSAGADPSARLGASPLGFAPRVAVATSINISVHSSTNPSFSTNAQPGVAAVRDPFATSTSNISSTRANASPP